MYVRGRVFILIFIVMFSMGSWAQVHSTLVNPDFWIGMYNCVYCTPKESSWLQSKKRMCEAEFKLNRCDQFAQKFPELKDNVKKCDEESLCREKILSSNIQILGCAAGNVEVLGDVVHAVQALPEIFKRKAPSESVRDLCLANASCALELKKIEAEAFKATQKVTAKSAQGLVDILNSAQSADFQKKMSMNSLLQFQQLYKKYFPERYQTKALDFVRKQFYKFDCLNAQAQAQLVCYYAFSIADPLWALKLVRVDLALARLLRAVVFERRSLKPLVDEEAEKLFAQQTKVTRSVERQQFVDQYLRTEITNLPEREKFIGQISEGPRSDRLVVSMENAYLKDLNDLEKFSLNKDKDLNTSINNFLNSKMSEEVERLARSQSPPLQIRYKYSDGKSVEIILEGQYDKAAADRFALALDKSRKKLMEELVQGKIVRRTDIPDEWFRVGLGQSTEQANVAARFSRELPLGQNRAIQFSSEAIQENLRVFYHWAQSYAQDLVAQPALSGFVKITQTSSGSVTHLSEGLLGLARKNPSVEKLKPILQKNSQGVIDDDLTQRILDYAKVIDVLNPKNYVADQGVVTLANSVGGGAVLDRIGMGGLNQEATAIAVSGSKEVDDFLKLNREQEQRVTEILNRERADFANQTGGRTRGDDSILPKLLSEQDKRTILKSSYSNDRRIVFVPPDIKEAAVRTSLGTSGEGIHKILTDDVLIRDMPIEKIKKIKIAVDIKTTRLGEGPVDIMIQPVSGASISPTEREYLRNKFDEAVRLFNQKQRDSGKAETSYFFAR